MKTKYEMMQPSEITDFFGKNYPDLATFQIGNFETTIKPMDYKLAQIDTERFYDTIYSFYGTFAFFDDIILWLNDVDWISNSDENFQKTIKIYATTDINNWYFNGVRGETLSTEERKLL